MSEFARMNPRMLLEETEKAIGNSELHSMHRELIEKKKMYKEDKQVGQRGCVAWHRCRWAVVGKKQ